jgi:CobQ-like glutamine amidotransferase family enzyme
MGKRLIGDSQIVRRMRTAPPQSAARGSRPGRHAGPGLGALLLTAALSLAGVAFPWVAGAAVASKVTTPAVTVTTSPAVGARAGYTVAFTTSATGGLSGAAGSTVTMVFPTGTGLGSLNSANLTDTTTNQVVGFANDSSTTTLSFAFFGGAVVHAGDSVSADVEGVVNPATAKSTYTLTVSTSSDTTPVTSGTYAIVAGHPVSAPAVTVTTSPAVGARAGYTVAFTTSATGGLSAAAGSTVTMVFPAGTGLGSLTTTNLTDTTTGQVVGFANDSSTTTLTFVFFGGAVVHGGDSVSADVEGAVNPATAKSTYTLTVSTSSDTTPVTSGTYAIVAGHPVSAAAVTVTTSPAAGARAGYTVAFATSVTGGLSAAAGSTVTMVFPAGTGLGSLTTTNLTDTTTGQIIGFANDSSTTTLTFVFFGGAVVHAGDSVSADVEGAVNPATAKSTYTLTVSTSSDTTPVTSGTYAIVAKNTVSIPMVSLSSQTPGATNVDYTVAFKASATGGLSAAAGSTVTMVFPAGTGLNSLTSTNLTDTTTSQVVGFANDSSTTTLSFVFFGGAVVHAGDQLSADVMGAGNPGSASSSDTTKVSTSSDTTPVTSCPYFIGTGPAAPCVTSVSPKSGPAAGGTSVKISGINFTGATAVKFGTAAATGVVVHSGTSITATSPAGTGKVNVTVTSPAGTSPTSPFDVFKYIAPPVVTTTSLPQGTVSTSYSATLAAKGGKTPYTWSISAGSLPPGLALNASTGVISGTPTSSGTFNFTVQVTDSENPPQNATKALSITIT